MATKKTPSTTSINKPKSRAAQKRVVNKTMKDMHVKTGGKIPEGSLDPLPAGQTKIVENAAKAVKEMTTEKVTGYARKPKDKAVIADKLTSLVPGVSLRGSSDASVEARFSNTAATKGLVTIGKYIDLPPDVRGVRMPQSVLVGQLMDQIDLDMKRMAYQLRARLIVSAFATNIAIGRDKETVHEEMMKLVEPDVYLRALVKKLIDPNYKVTSVDKVIEDNYVETKHWEEYGQYR